MSDTDVDRLRARVANLERMADRLAHELTTPLSTAHGFARVLLDGSAMPDDVRGGLERIERATGTALAMLRSRMDEGVGEEPRSVRLRTVVRDAVTSALGDHAAAGQDLPEEARVFVDPAGLHAALGLLLTALAEHAAARGVNPADLVVELAQERETSYQLRLDLHAPGLPPDVLHAPHPAPGAAPADDVPGRLRRADALFGVLGARMWLDHPGASAQRLSLLVELPRDVAG